MSDAECPVDVTAKEGFAPKRVALLPLRGPGPKCPCIAIIDGQDSSCMASTTLFLAGLEALM